jgi:hypothetical protein
MCAAAAHQASRALNHHTLNVTIASRFTTAATTVTLFMNSIDDSTSPAPAARKSSKFDRWPAWLLSLAAGLVAAKLGWDFGAQLSGPLLGVVCAVNLGAIAALLVDAGIDKLWLLVKRR